MNLLLNSLFILLIMTLTGCVIISKKEIIETQQQSIITDQNCKKTHASVTYLEVLNGAVSGEFYVDPYEKNRGDIKLASYYIAEQLKYRNVFSTKPNENDKPKVFVEFQAYSERELGLFQKTWHWLMFLSLGIIPSWGSGNDYLTAIIKDENGKVTHKFTSHKIEFTYLNGIIFLPFNFFHSYTPASLDEEFVPKMTDNIIDQMIASKIICDTSNVP